MHIFESFSRQVVDIILYYKAQKKIWVYSLDPQANVDIKMVGVVICLSHVICATAFQTQQFWIKYTLMYVNEYKHQLFSKT